mgnify:FL=1
MTAVDIAEVGLKIGKKMAADVNVSVNFVKDDALNLHNFSNYSFDIAVSVACLHMLVEQNDRNKFLHQVHRVLKRTGLFFLLNQGDGQAEGLTPRENWFAPEKRRVPGPEDRFIELATLPSWRKTLSGYREELEHNQFELVESFVSENNEYGKCISIVARRTK